MGGALRASALIETPFILRDSLLDALLGNHHLILLLLLLVVVVLMLLVQHEQVCGTLRAVCIIRVAQTWLLHVKGGSFCELDGVHRFLPLLLLGEHVLITADHHHTGIVFADVFWGVESRGVVVAVLLDRARWYHQAGPVTHRLRPLPPLTFRLLIQTLPAGVMSRLIIHVASPALILFGGTTGKAQEGLAAATTSPSLGLSFAHVVLVIVVQNVMHAFTRV